MVEPDNNANPTGPLYQPFVDQWATCVHQASEATKEMLGDFSGNSDPQAWRRKWFDALSGNADVYLRSAPFLEMMKAHVETMILAKRSSDAAGTGVGQNNADKAQNLKALADRLDNLDIAVHACLEKLEQRVDALENGSVEPSRVDGWDRFLDALRIARPSPESMLGATPHEVIYREGPLRLLRYRPESPRFAEPILICFALVNRPYILDLQTDRSVVRQLLARGFDVYLIDWGVPASTDHTLRLDDYVCRFLRNVAERVCAHAGASQVNLLGYCMGGTMSTIFTALHQERVRNLILMATPIDFDGEAGLLNLWAQEQYFDVDRLIDTYGNCPGEFLQYCFQLMKPVQNYAEKFLTLCDKLDDESFLDNFFAMERWANDSIPVAGETFREYVKKLYQQNQLVKGEMSLGGERIRLSEITCPLLLLVADQDHLVPPSSTLALQRHVSSSEVRTMSIAAGHIGLAVSSKAHRQLWPEAANWMVEHVTQRV